MKRSLLASAALLVTITSASAQEFYVVQDSSTRRCTIVEQRPSSGTMSMVSGTKVYTSRAEAQAAMSAAAPCTAAATNTDAPTTIGTANPGAQVRPMAQAPANAVSITKMYKQAVYDNNNARIGEVDDVLMASDGRAAALVIGVGGFLGIGEKHVIVPFSAVTQTERDGSVRLIMNSTKEELTASTGFRYEKSRYVWVAADSSQTTPARK